MNNTDFPQNGVTGHRGDPQHHPENTLEAFEGAMKLGCDWVETDLRLTRDNRVVLSHDGHTGTHADRKCVIADTDFADLRKLNMAVGFNMLHDDKPPRTATIPTLEEALELFRGQNRVRLSLQPKTPGSLEAAHKIIRDMNVPDELLGFNDGNLSFMTQARAFFPGAAIFFDRYEPDCLESDLFVAKRAHFQAIVIYEGFLTSAMVERIADEGIEPGVWNVDNPGELDRFLDMGVRRFYTNVPRVLLDKIRERRRGGA